MPKIITANRLDNGGVAYLNEAGGWSDSIDHAHVFEQRDATQRLEKLTACTSTELVVVSVYLMEVTVDGCGKRCPQSARERIRASNFPSTPGCGI